MPAPVPGSPTYYQDALTQINEAIYAVETRGQRYKIGDRELWRGDLEWMYSERRRLEPLAAKESRGGVRIRRVVPL